MDVIELEKKLKELVEEFYGETPQEAVTTKRTQQRLTDKLQEHIDTLRVYIKYQKFDMEAIRRENACLRKLLEKYQED